MTRFVVSRTYGNDEEPPCPEAVKADVVQHLYYTFPTVAEAKERHPDKEFEKCSGVVRTVGRLVPEWVVYLNSLDDLLAFYGRHGRLVILPWWQNHEIPEIEIYDGWRE